MASMVQVSDESPLPALPSFKSRDIERKVFTHRSYYGRPNHVFEDQPTSLSPDNEKFEHLGDSVLSLVITEMLLEMYPGLRVGPSTVIGNTTLAIISRRYQLSLRLFLHPAQAIALRASPHVQADVFEAFVGGLYTDQGLEVVKPWLRALFRPYAMAAYNMIRAQHGLPPISQAFPGDPPSLSESSSSPSSSPTPSPPSSPQSESGAELPLRHAGYSNPEVQIGYLALFNQTVGKKNLSLEWRYDPLNQYIDRTSNVASGSGGGGGRQGVNQNFFFDPAIARKSANMTPVWIVKAMINGECYGEGKGATKKAAKNNAAKMGLQKLGVAV
ncbi:hypothetical protein AAF712_002580 [Marasmius tenuissimus]|uniref:Uncharacterized protein n=1 Tax=Marasmius tenuissimus TaxID=585030 RepID=A0ABR3A8S6_9AGAR